MSNKKGQKFITVSVKNYSTRKTILQHQNNILKEIYSPIRNDRESMMMKRGSGHSNFLMEKILEEPIEEEAAKKKKIKVNLKDKRRDIKTYKRCYFEKPTHEETIINQMNKIQGLLDFYRSPAFSLKKDKQSILANGLNDLYKRKKISRKTAESIYSLKRKQHHPGVSFHIKCQKDEEDLLALKKETKVIAKENPLEIMDFTGGFVEDTEIKGKTVSLQKLNNKLKKNNSLHHLYNSVKKYEKADMCEISKLKSQDFFSLVTVNERFKKVGKLNSKLQQKMIQLNFME